MRRRISISAAAAVFAFAAALAAQPTWTDGADRFAGYPLGDLAIEGLAQSSWDLGHAERDGVVARFAGPDGRPAVLVRAIVAPDAAAVHAWMLARMRGVAREAERRDGFCDVAFVAGRAWAAFACGNVGVEVRVPGDGPEALDVLALAKALLGSAPRGTPPAIHVRARIRQDVVRVEAPAGSRIDWRPRSATLAPVADGVRLVSVRSGARIDVVAVDPLLRVGTASVCP